MERVCRAVVDVGTNSIKLLVAEVSGREVFPLWEESRQTRLGQGFYETHRLQAEPIANTARAVADFAGKARAKGASTVRVIATSAAREAQNAGELTAAIERESGLAVRIISGEQEAAWAFQGVTTDSRLARVPLLLLDVGGGSTEFILGSAERRFFQQSFPLGTVRLLEKLPHSDPPRPEEQAGCRDWLLAFLEGNVAPELRPALRRARESSGAGNPVHLVGTGGTASILACMEAELSAFDRERLETTVISQTRLRWHAARLWGLPLEKRRRIVGLPENRADVILLGVAIHLAILEHFGFDRLRVSTRGLRFAAVLAEE